MKRARTIAILGLLCGLFAARPAAAAFTCGLTSIANTENPTSSGTYTLNFFSGTTWTGTYNVTSNFGATAYTNGMLYVTINQPAQVSDPTGWPWHGSVRVNGSSVQFIMEWMKNGQYDYFEGVDSFAGPYNGGSITIGMSVYGPDSAGNLHGALGNFTATGTTSSFYQQFIIGAGIPCPSSSPKQLASSFNYNLEFPVSGQFPNGTWIQGTVSSYQPSGSPYVQLHLSDPNDGSHQAWVGYAACVIDPNSLLWCRLQTGQNFGSNDIGDPLWTVKLVASPYYYYQYCKDWYCENDGMYIDFWNF